ncbi:MAG: VCBS repeat-containing protein, partial [Actinomycetota bacterium]|nr:VCBS repeat-containing protein [Actinomycetota bacterium]
RSLRCRRQRAILTELVTVRAVRQQLHLLPAGLFPQPDPVVLGGLVTTDLDSDGHAGVAVLVANRIQIAYGDGSGALSRTTSVSAGQVDPSGLVTADVTGDGRLDLVTDRSVVPSAGTTEAVSTDARSPSAATAINPLS